MERSKMGDAEQRFREAEADSLTLQKIGDFEIEVDSVEMSEHGVTEGVATISVDDITMSEAPPGTEGFKVEVEEVEHINITAPEEPSLEGIEVGEVSMEDPDVKKYFDELEERTDKASEDQGISKEAGRQKQDTATNPDIGADRDAAQRAAQEEKGRGKKGLEQNISPDR